MPPPEDFVNYSDIKKCMLKLWVLKRGLFINHIFCDKNSLKLLANSIPMDRYKMWKKQWKSLCWVLDFPRYPMEPTLVHFFSVYTHHSLNQQILEGVHGWNSLWGIVCVYGKRRDKIGETVFWLLCDFAFWFGTQLIFPK